MATALVKGVVAVGTLATASGVGTAIYFNTGTTIGDKLAEKKLTLISDINDYKYHLFEHKDSKELKKALNKQTIDHTDNISDLKRWCNESVKGWASSDKDESIFKKVKEWCVVPTIRTLGDKLGSNLHGPNEWQGKYTSFSAQNGGSNDFMNALKDEFKGFDFTQNASQGGEKLKAWCEAVMKLNTYDVTTHKSEANARTWCLKG
ncbi:hypothetical protein A6V39_05220 [Candidatus Mycoplasma haematobovis]|uniref:Uncharacterized protein n=1 Tax=Candidatus Mycoplasma haematobovis TaxID=432608 RepID=A0A1A9QDR2_9MOLU|nr:hypothetical protein [Candidatus Mycoplasma haematobovis]OAL09829.1 hypothetical protein A6V39_05220 [Candidatus Mycoplasma haematobovis]